MGTPVRTSVEKPRMKLGYELKASVRMLYPRYDMLEMPQEEYTEHYLYILTSTGAHSYNRLFEGLQKIYSPTPSGGAGRLTLLCFCIPGRHDFCHRRIFAQWWEDVAMPGMHVPELRLNVSTGEIEEHHLPF